MIEWKYVFNTNLRTIRYGIISTAQTAAKDAGYPYFVWNGRVFETDTLKDTGILETELS